MKSKSLAVGNLGNLGPCVGEEKVKKVFGAAWLAAGTGGGSQGKLKLGFDPGTRGVGLLRIGGYDWLMGITLLGTPPFFFFS